MVVMLTKLLIVGGNGPEWIAVMFTEGGFVLASLAPSCILTRLQPGFALGEVPLLVTTMRERLMKTKGIHE